MLPFSEKGEIATFLTFGALALIVLSSAFITYVEKNNIQTNNARASLTTPVCSGSLTVSGMQGRSCAAVGQWCVVCNNNRGPCVENEGVAIPFQCGQDKKWNNTNSLGECNTSCKVSVGNPSPTSVNRPTDAVPTQSTNQICDYVTCKDPQGCGGFCDSSQNNGCYWGGCKDWEMCGSGGTCLWQQSPGYDSENTCAKQKQKGLLGSPPLCGSSVEPTVRPSPTGIPTVTPYPATRTPSPTTFIPYSSPSPTVYRSDPTSSPTRVPSPTNIPTQTPIPTIRYEPTPVCSDSFVCDTRIAGKEYGCGGMCNRAINSGCGYGGCREWEMCGFGGSCLWDRSPGFDPVLVCGDKAKNPYSSCTAEPTKPPQKSDYCTNDGILKSVSYYPPGYCGSTSYCSNGTWVKKSPEDRVCKGKVFCIADGYRKLDDKSCCNHIGFDGICGGFIPTSTLVPEATVTSAPVLTSTPSPSDTPVPTIIPTATEIPIPTVPEPTDEPSDVLKNISDKASRLYNSAKMNEKYTIPYYINNKFIPLQLEICTDKPCTDDNCQVTGTCYYAGSDALYNIDGVECGQGGRGAVCTDFALISYKMAGYPLEKEINLRYANNMFNFFKTEPGYRFYPNQGSTGPVKGDVLFMGESLSAANHVTMISEVKERAVKIYQFNARRCYWLGYTVKDGVYKFDSIIYTYDDGSQVTKYILGWARKE